LEKVEFTFGNLKISISLSKNGEISPGKKKTDTDVSCLLPKPFRPLRVCVDCVNTSSSAIHAQWQCGSFRRLSEDFVVLFSSSSSLLILLPSRLVFHRQRLPSTNLQLAQSSACARAHGSGVGGAVGLLFRRLVCSLPKVALVLVLIAVVLVMHLVCCLFASASPQGLCTREQRIVNLFLI
jgi:hypothetical protein